MGGNRGCIKLKVKRKSICVRKNREIFWFIDWWIVNYERVL